MNYRVILLIISLIIVTSLSEAVDQDPPHLARVFTTNFVGYASVNPESDFQPFANGTIWRDDINQIERINIKTESLEKEIFLLIDRKNQNYCGPVYEECACSNNIENDPDLIPIIQIDRDSVKLEKQELVNGILCDVYKNEKVKTTTYVDASDNSVLVRLCAPFIEKSRIQIDFQTFDKSPIDPSIFEIPSNCIQV